ncbi:MAG: hypothetical protein JW918_02295 [Anaerolineae bacterium]|nr:hypothetical protein [Anaerolineae bacterium]
MNARRILSRIVMVIASGVLLAGCACPGTEPAAPTGKPVATEEMTSTEEPVATEETMATKEPAATEEMAEPAAGWQADGVIVDGEYAHQATVGEVGLWWRSDAEFLYLAMEASTTGWVSVGLDPEVRMKGANFIVGAVAGGEAQIWDAYGTAPVGNTHPPDEELGGTDDIVAYAGVEEGGVTRFEVQIPLDSGDAFDKPLEPGGTYPIIVAVGSSDSFSASHTSRAGGSITLD